MSIPFAVWHEGISEGQGTWVLSIDPAGDRLLLSNADGILYWHPLADCKLIKATTPDVPRLVMPVQAQPSPEVLIPNRAMRRNGHGF